MPDHHMTTYKTSATWDPAAFAAVGRAVSTTVTVTGAKVGDFAVARFTTLDGTGDTVSVSICAHVEAADTVRVVLINGSATAALNLASGTLEVAVFRVQ